MRTPLGAAGALTGKSSLDTEKERELKAAGEKLVEPSNPFPDSSPRRLSSVTSDENVLPGRIKVGKKAWT